MPSAKRYDAMKHKSAYRVLLMIKLLHTLQPIALILREIVSRRSPWLVLCLAVAIFRHGAWCCNAGSSLSWRPSAIAAHNWLGWAVPLLRPTARGVIYRSLHLLSEWMHQADNGHSPVYTNHRLHFVYINFRWVIPLKLVRASSLPGFLLLCHFAWREMQLWVTWWDATTIPSFGINTSSSYRRHAVDDCFIFTMADIAHFDDFLPYYRAPILLSLLHGRVMLLLSLWSRAASGYFGRCHAYMYRREKRRNKLKLICRA